MTPRDRRLLRDMLENAAIARDTTDGVDIRLFDETPSLKYTALYALLIVGEAANKISPEVRAQLPDVPWADIIATRHFVAHGYDRVDPAVVIGIAQDDLPALIDALRRFLDAEGPLP